MGTVIKNMIFSLKKMVKSGLDKRKGFCPKSQISIIYTKNNHLPAWRNLKIDFSRPLFTIMVILDKASIFTGEIMSE